MGPIPPDTPQQAGDFWVVPSIGDPAGGSLLVSVAIAVGEAGELSDTDVQAAIVAGGRSCALTQGPPAGALPAIKLLSVNQYARFTFDNPGDPAPESVTVTVRGTSTTFDLGAPPPPPPQVAGLVRSYAEVVVAALGGAGDA